MNVRVTLLELEKPTNEQTEANAIAAWQSYQRIVSQRLVTS